MSFPPEDFLIVGVVVATVGAIIAHFAFRILTKMRLESYGYRGVPLNLFLRDADYHRHTRTPLWYDIAVWQVGNVVMYLAQAWRLHPAIAVGFTFAVSGVMYVTWYWSRKRSFKDDYQNPPVL